MLGAVPEPEGVVLMRVTLLRRAAQNTCGGGRVGIRYFAMSRKVHLARPAHLPFRTVCFSMLA